MDIQARISYGYHQWLSAYDDRGKFSNVHATHMPPYCKWVIGLKMLGRGMMGDWPVTFHLQFPKFRNLISTTSAHGTHIVPKITARQCAATIPYHEPDPAPPLTLSKSTFQPVIVHQSHDHPLPVSFLAIVGDACNLCTTRRGWPNMWWYWNAQLHRNDILYGQLLLQVAFYIRSVCRFLQKWLSTMQKLSVQLLLRRGRSVLWIFPGMAVSL
jgi:hypothetical protein